MKKANIFDIERGSFVDGPGIRTTVFFKGCNLSCAWCHNPESQSALPQMMFHKDKCTGCGKCREKCPHALETCDHCGKCTFFCPHDAREICGKEYTVDEVWNEILKDLIFYENSEGGVTFSGGECLLQIEFLTEILRKCHENGIHTAVDTAGHVSYDRFEQILPYTDLFLYDIKCWDSQTHKKFTGVGNELILENLKKLFQTKKSLWIRIPVIPTVNDNEPDMHHIRMLLDSFGTPDKVELLPYHVMGEHKYTDLGRNTQTFSVPSPQTMESLKKIFE